MRTQKALGHSNCTRALALIRALALTRALALRHSNIYLGYSGTLALRALKTVNAIGQSSHFIY